MSFDNGGSRGGREDQLGILEFLEGVQIQPHCSVVVGHERLGALGCLECYRPAVFLAHMKDQGLELRSPERQQARLGFSALAPAVACLTPSNYQFRFSVSLPKYLIPRTACRESVPWADDWRQVDSPLSVPR